MDGYPNVRITSSGEPVAFNKTSAVDICSCVYLITNQTLHSPTFCPHALQKALDLSQNEQEMVEHIILQMEEESGLDRAAAIAVMRFGFIGKVCDETVVKPKESREHARSRRMDQFLTGKYTAIPAFIGIMGLVFWLTFNVIGAWLSDLLDMGITYLTDLVDALLTSAGVNTVIHSLVIDGIFNGVGSVLSFLPIIVTLFFFLSMLEDSGYMARVAFVMDKLLRKIGLSGRSIVPMLIGFGCMVPGVMASRTLPSERDRKMTILLTSFMSCSAKLPIYAFFTAAFFPGHGALVMVGLYFLRIVMGILMALITGFMAKESVVSTLSILFGSTESLLAAISPLAAVSLLVFSLLYTLCVAAVSSIKRELGGKWALYVVIGQCVIAWIAALVVRLLGMAIGIF